MTYVVSLREILRPARYDGKSWSSVRIEESSSPDGPFTILETQPLTGRCHALVNLTTGLATLTAGWYRVIFVDADGHEQPLEPIPHNTSVDITPTVGQVASLLLVRTYAGGNEVGTFDDTTRPTGTQVAELCRQAAADVEARIGAPIPVHLRDEAQRLATLQAATLVELSFFNGDTPSVAQQQYSAMFLAGMQALSAEFISIA